MSNSSPDLFDLSDTVALPISDLHYEPPHPSMLEPCEGVWKFNMDILLTLTLALCSFLANIGLLCLARITRPASQANNSSFSANFTATNNMNSISNPANLINGNGNNGSTFAFNPLFTPRHSVPTKRSKCLDYSQYSSDFGRLDSTTTLHLKKCASALSLLRFSQALNGSTAYSNPSPCRTRRSRRQQRYLRGLLGLSISNLTLSISLIAYSICQILVHHDLHKKYRWIHWLQFVSVLVADMAQSFELVAVLWIALERTLGIHWPSEKRISSPRTAKQHSFNSSILSRLCRRLQCCIRPLETKSHTLHDMAETTTVSNSRTTQKPMINAFRKSCERCKDIICFCKHEPYLCQRTLSKHNRKNLSHFIRFSLCILPSILFITAVVYKISLLRTEIGVLSNRTNNLSWTNICLSNQMQLQDDDQLFSMQYAWFPVYLSTNQTSALVYYYTDAIVSALVIGQFLAPLAILVTTNLLIYRKVAARDKPFFSRQSSNTSKSSFISTTSSVTTTTTTSVNRKPANAAIAFPIPLLRVLESSNQDIRVDRVEDSDELTPNMKLEPLQSSPPTKPTHSLLVPETATGHHPYSSESFLKRASPERRNSTSVIGSTNLSLSCILDLQQSGPNCPAALASKSPLLVSPQQRRKSTNDIFSALFQSKTQDSNAALQKPNEEPLLLQVLRRQHRRTLRILIILLLVFVMCRAPRSIVLLIRWLIRNSCMQRFSTNLNNWLQYTSLWAYTSAILDTIVYGFWGNRAYRVHLRHWYARCNLCAKCK